MEIQKTGKLKNESDGMVVCNLSSRGQIAPEIPRSSE